MASSPRPNSLQQAASAVFAVTTVVPLLIFVWTLHRLGSLSRLQSQIGLGLALGIALLGYYIFRRLMGQMSELIRGLGRAVGTRSAVDGHASAAASDRAPGLVAEYRPPALGAQAHTAPSASAPRLAPAREATAAASAVATPTAPTAATPTVEVEAPRPQGIPGLGMIQEVDDLSRAMAKLWMGEAIAYKDRRVALSIMNSRVPITGTLIDVTPEGLLVDQDGGKQVAVSFARLSGIDAA
jgi:hypothetical protein